MPWIVTRASSLRFPLGVSILYLFYSLSEKEVRLIELQNRNQDAKTRYKAMQSSVKGRRLYVHLLTWIKSFKGTFISGNSGHTQQTLKFRYGKSVTNYSKSVPCNRCSYVSQVIQYCQIWSNFRYKNRLHLLGWTGSCA